ncbi:MAG: hypothetical protein A2812_03545 [Candidatus Staskawiczbacteria bacterium RIFCSPHIGHO2_01_FULL_36_16]|uniref:Uncharacterized protein n=1 Tax=Candidatus Staskawiczbacteria bacterium RIFCSPHIGHO2_01_FULL_36_16 TaxID=1802200 RepID=A0A1G2HRZ2_9BACT|nr:MAG: hypothetical protein A2812_03545 [Candidatus Staskawiczbacteria bacterium RIFCSPHIGHO2_01_FULL_36_16]
MLFSGLLIVIAVFGFFLLVSCSRVKETPGIVIGILVLVGALAGSFSKGFDVGRGCIAFAESKLSLGETYECIVGPDKSDDIYFAVVKTGDGKIYGLQFKELPPKNGVVSKTGGEIVFLPISDNKGTVIPNPLSPAETAEKPVK